MKRLLLCGLTIAGLGLASWASHSGSKPGDGSAADASVPHSLGAIHPRIAPDGRQIVFSYQGAIWRIAREGGTMTRLSDGAGFDIEPVWSPDGSLVAYVNSPRMAGGAETGTILAENGFSEDEIAALREAGAMGAD